MTYGCKIMVSLTLCSFFWTTLYTKNNDNCLLGSFYCHTLYIQNVWLVLQVLHQVTDSHTIVHRQQGQMP